MRLAIYNFVSLLDSIHPSPDLSLYQRCNTILRLLHFALDLFRLIWLSKILDVPLGCICISSEIIDLLGCESNLFVIK